MTSKHEKKFASIIQELVPREHVEAEYRFDAPVEGKKQRRWRFDFAIPKLRIAFEVEGGIWNGGRHVHPQGFKADCEKYNEATRQGWKVYRLPPSFITKDYIQSMLNALDVKDLR